MPFKVTDTKWLETESARVTSIILMPKFWHRAWTDNSLQATLAEIGLYYSMPEIRELNDELHKQGSVEDVGIAGPEPAPEPVSPE